MIQNAGLDDSQAGTKIARNINNLRYANDTTLTAQSEELKNVLGVKEESQKAGLIFNIKKKKTVAPSPITSWQIEVKKKKKVKAVTDFIFSCSKTIVKSDCSHEIWRWLLLGSKVMANLDSVLKKKYHFAKKDSYSKSYGLSSSHVQMWEVDHKNLSTEELMLLTCGTGEDSSESLGLQGDQTNKS